MVLNLLFKQEMWKIENKTQKLWSEFPSVLVLAWVLGPSIMDPFSLSPFMSKVVWKTPTLMKSVAQTLSIYK